jgi:hypothetical protein
VGTEFVNLRYDQLANMHNPAQDITQAYFENFYFAFHALVARSKTSIVIKHSHSVNGGTTSPVVSAIDHG